MIIGFKNKAAETILKEGVARGVSGDVARAARRRLQQLDNASSVDDMRSPPGNQLHWVGDAWSIRVNRQFRITFTWEAEGPDDVWFGDYH